MNKSKSWVLAVFFFMMPLFCQTAFAQEQQQEYDTVELAAKEADRLQSLLDLEDWQVFYVDSTLVTNYEAMDLELRELQKAKVGNMDLYIAVQDKWMEKTDQSYKNIFTEQQWSVYLKNGAARAQKQREKRRAKAEGKK